MYYMLQQTFHINAKHSHTPDIRHHGPREDLTNVFNRTRRNEPGGLFLFCIIMLFFRYVSCTCHMYTYSYPTCVSLCCADSF